MLQPGKPLKQRPQYVIEKVIGEGGFGITYKARHQDLNFPVVIKTPNSREGYLDTKSIDDFPCEDLRTIDHLWVQYSSGKFGFSVQTRIYQGLGGTREYKSAIWQKFGDTVGWRKGQRWLSYRDITFDKASPEGNLPNCWGREAQGWGRLWLFCAVVSSLSSRLVNFKI